MSDPLPPPEVSSEALSRPMTKWLRLALFSGLAPLVLGVLTYVAWRQTHAVAFEIAGTLLLLFGGILFVIGWFALLIHVLSNPASTREQRWKLWGPSLLAALFLGLQVPLLIAFVSDVGSYRRSYVVIVENESGADLESLRISKPRGWSRHEPVRAGTRVTSRSDPAPEGAIRYRFVLDGQPYEGLLDGTPSPGGTVTLRIEPGGRVVLTRSPR